MYEHNIYEKTDPSEMFTRQQHTLSLNNPFLNELNKTKDIHQKSNKNINKQNKEFIVLNYGNVSLKLAPIHFNYVQRHYSDVIEVDKTNSPYNKFAFKVYRPIDSFLSVEKIEQLLQSNTRYSKSTGLFGLIKKNINNFSIACAINDAMSKFRNLRENNQKYSTFICEISTNNIATYSVYISITESDFE